MVQIKEECMVKGPKAAIEGLSLKAGGLLGATASGELPRMRSRLVMQSEGRALNLVLVIQQQMSSLLLCSGLMHKIQ